VPKIDQDRPIPGTPYKKIQVISIDRETRSIGQVARAITESIPDAELIDSPNKIRPQSALLCLHPRLLGDIRSIRRYKPYYSVMGLLLGDTMEYTKSEILGLFGHMIEGIPVVSPSPYIAGELRREAKANLAPSRFRSMRFPVELMGLRPGFSPGENDKNSWVLPTNRWLDTAKQCSKASDVLRRAAETVQAKHSATPHVRMVYAPDASPTPEVRERHKSLSFEIQPKQLSVYQKQASETGISLCMSTHESFGLYHLELIASGCCVVFLDRPWIRSLLPDYPYLYGEKDLESALLTVWENFEEVSKDIREVWSPRVIKEFDLSRWSHDLCKYLHKD
jgi:hypothetical protein